MRQNHLVQTLCMLVFVLSSPSGGWKQAAFFSLPALSLSLALSSSSSSSASPGRAWDSFDISSARSSLYYTILCYAMLLCYTMLYYTMLYYAILCYTMLYYAILCYAILCYTLLYSTLLYSTLLYYTRLDEIILKFFFSSKVCEHHMTLPSSKAHPDAALSVQGVCPSRCEEIVTTV